MPRIASTSQRLALALTLSASLAYGIAPRRKEVLLLQHKPASLLRLDLAAGTLKSSIPLDKDADYAFAHPRRGLIYVIHRRSPGRLAPARDVSHLSVVDLSRNAVVRYIPVGKGASEVVFSKDGEKAFCFAGGGPMMKGQTTAKPENAAMVTVLNTRNHEVEVVYRSDKGADEFLVTDDGGRVVLLSSGTRLGSTGSAVAAGLTFGALMSKALPKDVAQEVAVFGGASTDPLKRHSPATHFASSILSQDQSTMVLIGWRKGGAGGGQGVMHTLNLNTGEISEPAVVGRDPRRLFRLEDRPGIWLAGRDEVRRISEGGELLGSPIPLKWDGTQNSRNDKEQVEGLPGMALQLAGNKAAIQIVKRNGADKKQLALVDLERNRVETVVPVGKAGVRKGRKVGAFALAAGLSIGAGMAAYSISSPVTAVFYPKWQSGVSSIVKRPDGQYFYALDPESGDLTVIRSADGQIAKHEPFNSSVSLWAPPGSRYIFGLGANQIEVLDTETNARQDKIKAGSGGIVITAIDSMANEMYILGGKGIEVWDGRSGQPAGLITGLRYKSVVQIVLPEGS